MQLQKKSMWLLMHVIVATCAREPTSPVCSRYDYEERLLERVLRNELALETTLNEILKTNAKVVDALKHLEDNKAKVESTLTVMEAKQITIEARLSDFINNATYHMNSTLASNLGAIVKAASEIKENATVTVEQLVNKVHLLKDQLKVPSIFFFASISSTTTLSSTQDVVFPSVEVNAGQGYDPVTGKFTASVSGMYMFSVQYCNQYKKSVHLEIVHLGKTKQRSSRYDDGNGGGNVCVTMQITTLVAMGEQVWVRATSTGWLFADSKTYNTFSGTLIHV